ncbi:lysozyme inhibitor LprI family protein [Roseobacter sinensis]|uniref:DUF1311 domain-containing protein n=1 Tax=Roseobacter sinensis TaxID=2931391 RepID=A0ABT3BD27_9RHOB|nr:lysozyme inhibitor LprI family protein [Roseobacter sp. WL0113]MCV3271468.1 DUF1311 domain-containing protein [Roseobacter sp. WL0113]
MIGGYILSFLGGIAADIARKVFLPQSEALLARIIPSLQKESNKRANLEELEVRDKLRKIGKSPDLARHITENSGDFVSRLNDNQEADRLSFVEVEAERLESNASTQAEMTAVALARYEAADKLLSMRMESLKESSDVSAAAKDALVEAQKAWKEFIFKDARAEALFTAEGGSMEPMIFNSSLEQSTMSRLKELRHLQELLL